MTININIGAQFMQPITLRRFGVGAYVDGLHIEPSPLDMIINASIQPVPSSQYRFLPEGDSPSNFVVVYTNEVLETGKHAGSKPDEVTHNGITYRLYQISQWQDNGYSTALFQSTEVN